MVYSYSLFLCYNSSLIQLENIIYLLYNIRMRHEVFHPSQEGIVTVNELTAAGLYRQEKALIGTIPIITANWGKFIPTQTVIDHYQNSVPPDKLSAANRIGFEGAWQYPPDTDIASQRIQALHEDIATQLALQAIRGKGWDRVDALAIASITSHPNLAQDVRQRLIQQGLDVTSAVQYVMACAGGLAALIDFGMDPDLQGKNAAVVAIDSMGAHIDPGPEGYLDALIFGNGAGALTFKPGEDIQILAAQAHVQDDQSILFPESWTPMLIPENDPGVRINMPSHYQIGPGAESAFTYTDKQRMMPLHTNPSQYIRMKSREIYKYVTQSLFARMVDFFNKHPHFAQMSFARAIMHQPSQQVVTGLLEKWRGALPDIQMGWDMAESGSNNTSAATAFRQMLELAKGGKILRGIPTAIIGFGVGADVIAVAQF